jgi:hypothetical protein
MTHAVLERVDALEWQLRQVPGVGPRSRWPRWRARRRAMNEGNPRWYELQPNQGALNTAARRAPRSLVDNESCNAAAGAVYLTDHKADTLRRGHGRGRGFRQRDNDTARMPASCWRPAMPASRRPPTIVVEKANHEMLLLVYAAVILLCLRHLPLVARGACAIIPLALTSVLAEALMVWLGIGLKVATLPVIALGVGIGVDYALYVLSIMLAQLRGRQPGASLPALSLLFTGRW